MRGTGGPPDFLIVGGQRCGTTSLWEYLTGHPQVVRTRHKELHYFDRYLERGVGWYRAQFPSGLRRAWGRLVRDRGFLAGDATPSYMFVPDVPELVRERLPGVRLIALLRDPVARAWSHYQHNVRKEREPASFADAVRRDLARVRPGEPLPPRGDPRRTRHVQRAYVRRGFYDEQVERWWRVYPRERLLILESEAFYRDPPATLQHVSAFLGLDPIDWRARSFPVHGGRNAAVLDEATAASLRDVFRPHVRRLHDLTGLGASWPM